MAVPDDDDPRLAQIVSQARSGWPEFVDAFQKRTSGDRFLVKAPFTDGENGEWMWVEVTGIEGVHLVGTLQNSPLQVANIEIGDETRVLATEIGDWYYLQNGNGHGGFSQALLE